MKLIIKDVVKKVNVSIFIVLCVINKCGYVYEDICLFIEKFIKDLGFVFNQLVRSLINCFFKIIVVIVLYIGLYFYGELLELIES